MVLSRVAKKVILDIFSRENSYKDTEKPTAPESRSDWAFLFNKAIGHIKYLLENASLLLILGCNFFLLPL